MPKDNGITIVDFIKILHQEGYFSTHRQVSEISREIAKKGYNVPISSLRTTLSRLVNPGKLLIKTKITKKWVYIQKYPPAILQNRTTHNLAIYDFHPQIKSVSLQQFQDGHYKEAIQNALVEVIDQVKIRTGHPKNSIGRELDGDDLMNRVFGCENQDPMIKFNLLSSSLDRAEQRGLMNLFKGIVGIRDRKAHLNFTQNDPLKTIEYLSLASLLMRLLDEHTVSSELL
jgi:uncharacterized protein (TIGR02391 family)